LTVRRRLLIEGWRFIHHSYALVAQAHCLCILKRGDVDLRFRDLPFYSDAWKPTPGIFAPEQERALSQVAAPEPGFAPEATFSMRPERPDFSASSSGRKFVFGTAEYRVLTEENRSGLNSAAEIEDTVSVVAPSRWAALAFERFGLPSERIHVVPHGIDPAVMHPDEEERVAVRSALGVQDDVVFIAVGAMTWNKGLDILLAAFARVAETEPEVRLVLKGVDGLYPSRDFVREVLEGLPPRARETVVGRLVYEGRTVSARGMAHLLRGADCYVSPYRAEGFNLPVLEAMACGVPVICTAGGPTDEFTDGAFAQRIRSVSVRKRLTEKESGDALEPDGDHLVELMRDAARNRDRRHEAGARAARHAVEKFTWDAVTDRLLAALLPTSG
jgi:glycosyltransferase involved in cell wall biosynthesis